MRTTTTCILALFLAAAPAWAGLGGGWTRGEGRLWANLGYYYQYSDRKFAAGAGRGDDCLGCAPGDRIPFSLANGGRLVSQGVAVDAYLGLTDRVDFLLQVPYSVLRFEDANLVSTSQGISDVRVGLKYGLATDPAALAVHALVKAPTGEFDSNATAQIPLGEGQWDAELGGHAGLGFDFGWTGLSAGYRYRMRNADTHRKPGDELFVAAEGGVKFLQRLSAKAGLDATFGQEESFDGAPPVAGLKPSRREVVWLEGTLFAELDSGLTLQAGVRNPLMGVNYPAGSQYSAGLWWEGSLWE